MDLFLELDIAYRFFKSKAKDKFISVISLFSILGIVLGVGTLIVVMSVMNGYEKELIDRLSGIDGDLIIENYTETDFEKVKAIGPQFGLEHVLRQVEGQGMLIGRGDLASAVAVRGISESELSEKRLIADNLRYGSMEEYEEGGILLGPELAIKLGVNIGDSLRLVVASGTQTLMGFIPKFKTFKVVGVFDTGMYEHNLGTVFIPSSSAEILFPKSETRLEIKLLEDSRIDAFTKVLVSHLSQNVFIISKFQANNHLREALKVERVVMYMILTLIILVAVFNIISSLIILVKDKNKNIAILKAYGMSSGSIQRIFILAGSLIGLIGTVFGGLIGIIFVLNIERLRTFLEGLTGVALFNPVIYYLTNLPAIVDWSSVCAVILTALALTLIATFYPSFRASRLDPIKILRDE